MSILTYENFRALSEIPDDETFEITQEQVQLILLSSIVFLGILTFPTVSHAVEKIKKTSSEDFFMEGDRQIKKCYKVYDYRDLGEKLKEKTKANLLPKKEILGSGARLEINISSPVIDLTPLIWRKKEVIVPSIPLVVNSGPGITERLLLIKGGFTGYIFGKIFERVVKTAEEWVKGSPEEKQPASAPAPEEKKTSEKQRGSILDLSFITDLIKANPVAFIILLGGGYVFTKKETFRNGVKTTMPPKIAEMILGKKRGFKYYALKIVSFKQPYIYCIIIVSFAVMYRVILQKFIKREITSGEVISHITTSFLQTNPDILNKLHDLSKDFTAVLLKAEKRKINDPKIKEESQDIISILFPNVRKAEKEIWASMEKDSSAKNLLALSLEYDI